MPRIRLVIQYDGTDFCGWQEQPEQRTVQGTLKDCIGEVTNESPDLRGASRTDSGAHALGQVADFWTDSSIPASTWGTVLNRRLPGDLRVRCSVSAPASFNSRFWARSRCYSYRIWTGGKPDVRVSRYVYSEGGSLSVDRMNAAAASLIGQHDFRAFGEELEGVENCVRTVTRAEVARENDEVVFSVSATAYIRGMVRRMAGGLVEVGRGRRSPTEIQTLLDQLKRDDVQWPVVLPASGLCLKRVVFGRPMHDWRNVLEVEEQESS